MSAGERAEPYRPISEAIQIVDKEEWLASKERRLANEQEKLAEEMKKLADEEERLADEERKRADKKERLAEERKKLALNQESLTNQWRIQEREEERLESLEQTVAQERRKLEYDEDMLGYEERKRADEKERLAEERNKLVFYEERLTKKWEKLADEKTGVRKTAQICDANEERKFNSLEASKFEPQSLRAYLNQVRHLPLHMSRLLDLDCETSRLSGLNADNNCNIATATSAQTSIKRKLYPLRLQPWTEFPQEHRKVFSALQEQLQDFNVFPSAMSVELAEKMLEIEISNPFQNLNKVSNHDRTSIFLDGVIERPCSDILVEHYRLSEERKSILFDNKKSKGDLIPDCSARTSHGLSDGDTPTSGEADKFDISAQKPPGKTRPDCVVWAREDYTNRPLPDRESYMLAIGEHKSCHSIRAKDLENNPKLPEDCLIRMAIARKSQLVEVQEDQTTGDQQSDIIVISSSDSSVEPPDISQELQVFASALAETYHFMITSGLEYGYLATGETLTLLRVPLEDPTTLLYHTSLFPAVDPTDLPELHGHPVYPTCVTAPESQHISDNIGDDVLSELAVSQLASLCIMAFESRARPLTWIQGARELLAEFPNLPEDRGYVMSSSPDIRSENDIYSADDDDSDNCQSDFHHTMHRADESSDLAASPSEQDHHAFKYRHASSAGAGIRAVREDIMLPYCTHGCLLGLVRGCTLDDTCPNYEIHKNALPQPSSAEPQVEGQKHGISKADVCRLIQEQIELHPENNCSIVSRLGLHDFTKCLFKLSINGYGYTFVAKGVESQDHYRLMHETRTYSDLERLQGLLIPVNLGIINLRLPYPFRERFTTISYMMLMSYAGMSIHRNPPLSSELEEAGYDLEQEVRDTYEELRGYGIRELENPFSNATWCEDRRCVMKVDFSHCVVDRTLCRARTYGLADSWLGTAARNNRRKAKHGERDQTGDNGAASVTDMELAPKRFKQGENYQAAHDS